MRPELEIYEQIDRYLAHLMSTEERTAFELQMSKDAGLRESVYMASLTNELIVENAVLEKKAFLQQLEAGYKGPSSSSNWKIIIGIAVVAAAAAMVYFFMPRPTEKNTITTTTETVLEPSNNKVVTESNTEEVVQETASPKNNKAVEKNTERTNTETVVINPNPKEEEFEKTIEPVIQVEPSEKTEVKKEVKTSCSDLFKNISLESSPACKKESNGTIRVKGADKSVSIFLNEEKISTTESGLSAGTYTVVLKNSEGCMLSKSVRVESISCPQNKQLNWSFSDLGNWNIELEQDEAKLLIMDRAGKTLREETIRGNSYSVPSEIFPAAGVYQFRINYPDGETEQGYIQIVP